MHADGFAVAVMLQIVLGPLVGLACGWGLAKAMDFAQTKNLMAESASGIVFLSAAFMSYVGAEIVGGNGFIAAPSSQAWCLAMFTSMRSHFIGEFMEGVGQAADHARFSCIRRAFVAGGDFAYAVEGDCSGPAVLDGRQDGADLDFFGRLRFGDAGQIVFGLVWPKRFGIKYCSTMIITDEF